MGLARKMLTIGVMQSSSAEDRALVSVTIFECTCRLNIGMSRAMMRSQVTMVKWWQHMLLTLPKSSSVASRNRRHVSSKPRSEGKLSRQASCTSVHIT